LRRLEKTERCVVAKLFLSASRVADTESQVVIHDSATQIMDFNAKNFRYVTTEFDSFIDGVKKGDKTYLRALSEEKPNEKPALLADDFPKLASDFVLPPQLSLVKENLFSSVLRVSGPVNMWLHYDVSCRVHIFRETC